MNKETEDKINQDGNLAPSTRSSSEPYYNPRDAEVTLYKKKLRKEVEGMLLEAKTASQFTKPCKYNDALWDVLELIDKA